MSDSGRVNEILDDRPDLKEPLQKILDVEERSDSWTFGDVPLDSGQFGELVSRGIVKSVGEEY